MINIERTEVYGWESAIRGMRNPMNSWDKSDSWQSKHIDNRDSCSSKCDYIIGFNDLKLMKNLVKAGTDHSKFMRMITVTCDITAPLYWWKELDTYKVGTVRNSCSTMHKIADKEFTLEDFSYEHLFNCYGDPSMNLNYGAKHPTDILRDIIFVLNHFRNEFNYTKDKKYWWQIIQLLPSSYNQKATVQMNYQVLRNMYYSRKNHKLDEWQEFCKWVGTLPYSELITR